MTDRNKAPDLLRTLRQDKEMNDLELFFDSYDRFTSHTDKVPDEEKLNYYFINLVSEAGEVAGLYAKFIRDVQNPTCPEETRPFLEKYKKLEASLAKELGDLMWSVSRICDHYGLDLPEIVLGNAEKLTDRIKNNTISGSGDNR